MRRTFFHTYNCESIDIHNSLFPELFFISFFFSSLVWWIKVHSITMTAHWSYLGSINVSNQKWLSVWNFEFTSRQQKRTRDPYRNDQIARLRWVSRPFFFFFHFYLSSAICAQNAHALNRKTKELPFIQMADIIGDDCELLQRYTCQIDWHSKCLAQHVF